jgi:hypothetical protein
MEVPGMNALSRMAAGVVVAALALGAVTTLFGCSSTSAGRPTSEPTVSPVSPTSPTSPTTPPAPPTQLPASALVPFTSRLYGYTIDIPKGWGVRAATRMLDGMEPPVIHSTAVDNLAAGGVLRSGVPVGSIVIAASVTPPGATLGSWTAGTAEATCGAPASQNDISIDGEAATLSTYAGCYGYFHQWATVLHGGYAWHIVWFNNVGSEIADVVFFEQSLATFRFAEVPAAPAPS